MNVSLTVVANMTSNYGEGLGNVSSVQKVFRGGKTYAIRSRESLKNAVMVNSNMYDDLQVSVDGATQKKVNEELNASNCRSLEGGYMNTSKTGTYIRNSSFYLTDAVSCNEYIIETRFHNNLFLAQTSAKEQGVNLQDKSKMCGLMPYQYEYDKDLKVYSITIDLDMIGKDINFNAESTNDEKAERVNTLLSAIEELSLVVKGNLDNAEPIFVVGGITSRKTHYFENVVRVKENTLVVSEELIERTSNKCAAGLLSGGTFKNEAEIKEKLKTKSVSQFFTDLRNEVNQYYGV